MKYLMFLMLLTSCTHSKYPRCATLYSADSSFHSCTYELLKDFDKMAFVNYAKQHQTQLKGDRFYTRSSYFNYFEFWVESALLDCPEKICF